MQRDQTIGHWLPIAGSGLLVLLATALLALSILPHGAWLSEDSVGFWRHAVALRAGNGLVDTVYLAAADAVATQPLTHHPPLLSSTYAALLAWPIPATQLAAVLSLLCWPLFLIGIGVLAYRLSQSSIAALAAIALSTLAPSFWYVFSSAFAEVLFLPLVVWFLAATVDLPNRERLWPHILPAAVLLALLLLTRYTGVFVLAATMLWWGWWHLAQGHPLQSRRLWVGWGCLGLASLPLALWLIRNTQVARAPFSSHLDAAGTFTAGLTAFGQESFRMLVPILNIGNIQAVVGTVGLVGLLCGYGLVFAGGGVLLWRCGMLARPKLLAPQRSPIQLFALFYALLYTVLQPFFSFTPIDLRDITSLLSVVLPFLVGVLLRHGGKLALLPLGGHIALSAGLMLAPLLTQGLPDWVRLNPPQIIDVGNRDVVNPPVYQSSGILAMLQPRPVRPTNLQRHLPNLHTLIAPERGAGSLQQHFANLRTFMTPEPTETIVITNDPRLFVVANLRAVAVFRAWEAAPRCTSQQRVLLIAVEWSDTAPHTAEEMRERVQAHCPDLVPERYDSAVVYRLRSE